MVCAVYRVFVISNYCFIKIGSTIKWFSIKMQNNVLVTTNTVHESTVLNSTD